MLTRIKMLLLIATSASVACGATASSLQELNKELISLVNKAAPAVVEVRAERIAVLQTAVSTSTDGKPGTSVLGKASTFPTSSVGSGFVFEADGYILTTSQVVSGAEKIKVKFADGAEADGKLVGADALTDVAVVKVEKTGLISLKLGDSDTLEPGALVISINNQAGMEGSVSLGIVAGVNRRLASEAAGLVQISGTVGPGASGGPVLDASGSVVAVTSAMLSPSAGALPFNFPKIIIGGQDAGTQGWNWQQDSLEAAKQSVARNEQELRRAQAKNDFAESDLAQTEQRVSQGLAATTDLQGKKLEAIEAETALATSKIDLDAAMRTLKQYQSGVRPFAESLLQEANMTTRTSGSSGFAIPINRIKPILEDLKFGREVERGWLGASMGEKGGRIVFQDVVPGQPADKAGIKVGDVLVKADDREFAKVDDFLNYVPSRKPGETMKLVVERGGSQCAIEVKLGKRPSVEQNAGAGAKPNAALGGWGAFSGGFGGSSGKDLGKATGDGAGFSVSLDDAGIVEVTKALSSASGRSIIVTDAAKITKKVTVYMKSTTVEKALDVICRTLECTYRKDGDTYVISPK